VKVLNLRTIAMLLAVTGAGVVLARLFGVVNSHYATRVGMMFIGVGQVITGVAAHRENDKSGRLLIIPGILILVSLLLQTL